MWALDGSGLVGEDASGAALDVGEETTPHPSQTLNLMLFQYLKRNNYPPGYRVLCMNCNFAMGHFGYCPHQKTAGLQTPA